jgi:hypothetical protein
VLQRAAGDRPRAGRRAALDWPRDRLTIQLLDDSTDITSDIAVHAVARLQA